MAKLFRENANLSFVTTAVDCSLSKSLNDGQLDNFFALLDEKKLDEILVAIDRAEKP